METIKKRIKTKEVIEYFCKCNNCGKEIVGSTDGQVAFNLIVHKQSKGCLKINLKTDERRFKK